MNLKNIHANLKDIHFESIQEKLERIAKVQNISKDKAYLFWISGLDND